MRVLHTSDWHLGASIEQVTCRPEHDEFLDWLAETIRERAIDVLVVSGDVFHYQNPGNRDERRYYDFLVESARTETLRKVVVVAGNHDSPSGLDAPRRVLGALDVEVVGGLPRDEERWEECLVPVENDAGAVELVVAAVPYVQRARLGVSLEDDSEESLHERFSEAFRKLYGGLADRAAERWPDARLVGTGHMTVYGADDETEAGDYHTALHYAEQAPKSGRDRSAGGGIEHGSVGTIEAMSPEIFDERYDYVALGHIHRSMPVGGRRHIRYSGTPVALSLEEARAARRVVVADFEAHNDRGDSPAIETLEVPKWRDKLELAGTMKQLEEMLGGLPRECRYPPALYLTARVTAEELVADRIGPLQELLDEEYDDEWRPIIVDLQEERTDAAEAEAQEPDRQRIDTADPMEVFAAIYERENRDGGPPPEEMVEAFREIAGEMVDDDSAEGER